MEKITTCLWFDTEAEEAAQFYASIFPDSRITDVSYYGEAGPGRRDGDDRELRADGPDVRRPRRRARVQDRSAADSFVVPCESQDEVDTFWSRLADGGEEIACGWITDRYGVVWQIVPTRLQELLSDPDREKAQRVMGAMLQMKKIEISELEHAAA